MLLSLGSISDWKFGLTILPFHDICWMNDRDSGEYSLLIFSVFFFVCLFAVYELKSVRSFIPIRMKKVSLRF